MEKSRAVEGYILAFITIIIWSGWMILSRLGMLSELSVFDLVFLRYTSSGIILLPVLLKCFHLITKENRKAIMLMVLGAGAPYLIFCNIGFSYAPASHGILTPSTMPLWVGLASYYFLSEEISRLRIIGYIFILCGAVFKVIFGEHGVNYVDLYFIAASLCWAVYTIQSKIHSYLRPIEIAAFVSCGNMFMLAIPYAIYQFNNPHTLPLEMSIIQIIYQGIFTGIISLITYNRAIRLIGASRTSSFAALAPVMVTLLAIPLLDEIPTFNDWIFVALMTVGVFLASGVRRLGTKEKQVEISGA